MKSRHFKKWMCMLLAASTITAQLPVNAMGTTEVLANESAVTQLEETLELMSETGGLLKAGSISVTTEGTTVNQPLARGADGVDIFRIPCLITLKNGDILAAADARYTEYRDFGGIDTIASVSSDGGKTWSYSYPIYFPDSTGSAGFGKATTAIDPMLVQGADGTIYCMADMNPTGVTTFDTWPGKGTGYITVDGKERLALTTSWDTSATQPSESVGADGNYTYEYYVGDFTDGYAPVIDRKTGEASAYAVDEWYNIYSVKNGEYVADLTQQVINDASTSIQQNAFYKDSVLHVYKTGYIWVVESKDNGRTWENPHIINPQIKRDDGQESALLVSPGQGLLTSTGDIVVGCYNTLGSEYASIFYSSDNGVTWKRSEDVPMTKSSENELIELEDGTIRMFYRNNHMKVCYVDATRDANGDYTFGTPQVTDVVSSSNCNVTAVKLKERKIDGKPVILVANPSTPGAWNRNEGRINVFTENPDKSMDLVYTYHINEGTFAYSCMTELSNGNIGILWEPGINEDSECRYDEIAIEEVLGEINEKNLILDKGTEYTETHMTDKAMELTTQADISVAQVTVETEEKYTIPMFDRSGSANSSAPRESFSAAANTDLLLENAEFEFQGTEAENVYTIYNKFANKYLTNEKSAGTFFNDAPKNMYVEAVDAEEGAKEFRISLANKTRYIMFYTAGMNYNSSGNYNSNMDEATYGSQELVLLEKQETTSDSDVIPGYARATAVTAGKKYLITYIMGTNVIVLYPTNGQDAQTKLVDTTVDPELVVTNNIKILPVANGNTSAVIDGVTYNIQVKTPVIKSDVITVTAGSQHSSSGDNSAAAAIDGNLETIWQTHTGNDKASYDNHWITVDLGRKYNVDGFRYFTRRNGTKGCITKYEIYTSIDGVEFTKATEGSWDWINFAWYEADFEARTARYVKLKTVESRNGGAGSKLSSAGEIQVRGVKANADADYSIVDAALATVPADLSDYTEETVLVLQAALDGVMRGYDEEKQAEVTAMAQAILDAVAALEKKAPGVSYKIAVSEITVTAGSQHDTTGNNSAQAVLDDNPDTIWHTNWNNSNDKASYDNHWITFDLGKNYMVDTLRYLSRKDGANGNIKKYEIYTSLDGKNFTKATEGDWAGANSTWYEANMTATEARYVKLKTVEATSGEANNKFTSAAEIQIKGYKKVETPEEPDTTVAVTGVTLNKTAVELTVGQTETLTATVAPAEVENKAVLWESGNTAVATVDENGTITALAQGTTMITVTSQADTTKKAFCIVTVVKAEEENPEQSGNPEEPHVHNYGEWNTTKAATCTTAGSKECVCACGEKETEAIAATGHMWDAGKVTTAPTAIKNGVKTYTCSVCKEKKTETVAAIGLPKKGKTFVVNGATYKVTKSHAKSGTVTFVKTKKNVKTIAVPTTVKLDGINYKVTAIEKNAFKNQKKVTTITIGSNVAKIGTTAFTGCSKLKNIKISTTKLTKAGISKNAFKGIGKNVKIKVPKKKFNAYKSMFKSKGLSVKVKVTK